MYFKINVLDPVTPSFFCMLFEREKQMD